MTAPRRPVAPSTAVERATTRSRWRPLLLLLSTGLGLLATAAPAGAHETTGDGIVVEVNDQRLVVTAPVPFAELGYEDTTGDGLIDTAELAAQEADVATTIVATVRGHVRLRVDGEDLEIIGAGVPAPDTDEPSATVVLAFASGPHDGDVTEVEGAWGFGSPSSEVVLSHPDGVIVGGLGEDDTAAFSIGAWAGATSFFGLGIDHIRFGPDHLLFLVVLTLAVAGTAVTPTTTWRTVKLVTAFTAGHAVSLGLAFFDVVSIPADLVEPAIAMSIVAAAILVLRGGAAEGRAWLAALIGLVHGLGFASSLESLGVATSQRVSALAAFNIGIDVAQTAVVLVVVAALWLASRALDGRLVFVRVPTATIAAAIGLVWTASRLAPGAA